MKNPNYHYELSTQKAQSVLAPIPVAARSKACSNPAGGMDVVSCECSLLSGRGLSRADHSSRGVPPSVVCLHVIVWSLDNERTPWTTRELLFPTPNDNFQSPFIRAKTHISQTALAFSCFNSYVSARKQTKYSIVIHRKTEIETWLSSQFWYIFEHVWKKNLLSARQSHIEIRRMYLFPLLSCILNSGHGVHHN